MIKKTQEGIQVCPQHQLKKKTKTKLRGEKKKEEENANQNQTLSNQVLVKQKLNNIHGL